MQVGTFGKNAGSNDPENFGRVAKIFVDPKTNEAYVADGYGNKRVAVLDADTGKIKRYWGAYGNKPDDTQPRPLQSRRRRPRSSSATRCTAPSCRTTGWSTSATARTTASRCSQQDGKFVKEAFFAKNTLGDGSVWDIAFSKDPQQKFIYLADGTEREGPHHRCARRWKS